MKRLNPDTGKPFVRGDTRADGFLFFKYNTSKIKKDGSFWERWLSPESFKREVKYSTIKTDQYYKNNPDKRKASRQKEKLTSAPLWRERNKDKRCAWQRKREADKLKRTPPWLTQEHLQQIESVYALAKQLTVETGIVHHVDHIVPLRG